jgi:hypothetical protein
LDGYDPTLAPKFKVYRGSLTEIARSAEQYAQSYNDRVRFENDRVAVYSFAAVNLHQAWLIAKGRAAALGIAEVEPEA